MSAPAHRGAVPVVTAILFLLLGLPLLAGGAWLLGLGGEPWFLIGGGLLVAVAALALRRLSWAAAVYAAMLLLAAAWATVDVGLVGWWWWPRVMWWWLLGWWWVTPWMWRRLRAPLRWCMPVTLLIVALPGALALVRQPPELRGKLADARQDALAPPDYAGAPAHEWIAYGRTNYGDRYAPAAQITPANVGRLRLAWSYRLDGGTHGAPGTGVPGQTPLAVNGLLYLCTRTGAIVALEQDSGRERWRYAPATDVPPTPCQGVAYYDSGAYARRTDLSARAPALVVTRPTPKGAVAAEAIQFDSCPRRIFAPVGGGKVMALNADNGLRCSELGTNGELGPGEHAQVGGVSAAPAVTRDALIVSAGVMSAYDMQQGKPLWQWPASGPERVGDVVSVDEPLGLAYAIAHDPADTTGAHDAIVAVDIASGELRWSHTAKPGSHGLRGQPVLFDTGPAQARVPALLATSRQGDLVVLDRRDGRAIAMPAQAASASPVSTSPSFAPQGDLRERALWGISAYDQLMCRIRFRQQLRAGDGALVYPGRLGVFEEASIAVDPARQLMIGDPGYIAYVRAAGTASVPLSSMFGLPCQAPPWGYVAAVDLTTFTKLWMRRNGVMADQRPWRVALPLGVPSAGGVATTGGGVAFFGGTLDEYVRAFDVSTGEPLWKAQLPASLQATPISFISDRSGRQYLLVVTAGETSGERPRGEEVMAYALPPPGQ